MFWIQDESCTNAVPRLELCETNTHLFLHINEALMLLPKKFMLVQTVQTGWMVISRFTMFVGNRVSLIVVLIPSSHWYHISDLQNPADWPSSPLFPSVLFDLTLWWNRPEWLKKII